METEIWKKHPEYVRIEVSSFGRVRTLDRLISSESMTRFTQGRILKQYDNGYGYLIVNIPVDGKCVSKRVHRLVAQTFIKNTDNLPQVNHRDCDRTNNKVKNLEWCDNTYNSQYREKYGESLGRPLFAINLATLEVSKFRSQHEASRELGVLQQSISKVIKGRYNQTGGYWFVNDDGNAVDVVKSKLHDIGKTGLKIK